MAFPRPNSNVFPPHRPLVRRREMLQVGASSLVGVGLAGVCQATPPVKKGPGARSVLVVFLAGGPSQLETFDMKPEAPSEVRGPFRPIPTAAAGVEICEHLPRMAARAGRFTILRTMNCSPNLGAHDFATPAALAGVDPLPPGVRPVATRHDWPCFAAGLDYVRPRSDGVPNGVSLPSLLRINGAAVAGQNAGFLGTAHDPWQIDVDVNRPDFQTVSAAMPEGLSIERVAGRRGILEQVERKQRALDRLAHGASFDRHQEKAFRILTSGRLSRAFNLEREPDRVRDRYGRHLFGASLLLARRLVQEGVPLVQANMNLAYSFPWDTHSSNSKMLKDQLLPPLDQAYSALLDDLEATGLLDETLVVMLGEFGRTPKLGGVGSGFFDPDGRDHWTGVFPAVFAGGGVVPGRVIGSSDRIAATPTSRGYGFSDLGATIYQALGVDPAAEVRDRLGRPMRLNSGERIEPLFQNA